MALLDHRHRCDWCGSDPLYVAYHDHDWGVPSFDDRYLFEMLTLEGAQAGLSWITILRKRDNYRLAFDHFVVEKVADYTEHKIAGLMNNPGVVRNRAKLESTITNARAWLEVQAKFGSFANYAWGYVNGLPIQNTWQKLSDVPATTPLATALSKDLKKRGFRFVGPTIIYAWMQSVGMVNDHLVSCFRHQEVGNLIPSLS
jgi:DNA-3-methyladenine glycosylase I